MSRKDIYGMFAYSQNEFAVPSCYNYSVMPHVSHYCPPVVTDCLPPYPVGSICTLRAGTIGLFIHAVALQIYSTRRMSRPSFGGGFPGAARGRPARGHGSVIPLCLLITPRRCPLATPNRMRETKMVEHFMPAPFRIAIDTVQRPRRALVARSRILLI